jgi:hypothetical protein
MRVPSLKGKSMSSKLAKRQGAYVGQELEEKKILKFPPNISMSADKGGDSTANIICFMVRTFSTAGYQAKQSEKGGYTDVFKDSGSPLYFIYLSTPGEQGTSYKTDWTFKELNAMALGLVHKGRSAIDSFLNPSIEGIGNGVAQIGGEFALRIATQYIEGFSPAVGSLLATSIQPYEELLFDKVAGRGFRFNFKMIPRNPSEIQTINDIIQVFKWAAHPGMKSLGEILGGLLEEEQKGNDSSIKTLGTRILSYPNVFEIRYLIGQNNNDGTTSGKDNSWIHKFGPSACTGIDVKYSPGAKNYASYRSKNDYRFYKEGEQLDVEGAPIFYELTLEFKEMITLTKESINEGL